MNVRKICEKRQDSFDQTLQQKCNSKILKPPPCTNTENIIFYFMQEILSEIHKSSNPSYIDF